MGSARTALFNWLFARHNGGVFILRIEDTDEARNREEWVEGIVSAMSWLGLDADEGPFRQSQRRPRHAAAVDTLVAGGHVYACDCSREEIARRTAGNATPGYDGHCRDRGLVPGPGRVLRFRVDRAGRTVVPDLIRGDVVFAHEAIEDFVVVKSDGQPLFLLANAVDDLDMGITHVIRGEDLLPSTPKGIMLWQALGDAGLPQFAHLPMLVNERRKKLSKRHDPVAVEQYRAEGYLPEAFRNYLALLGWSPAGDREIVPLDEMIATFDLAQVHHAPAFFDVKKLAYVNGEYVRHMSVEGFAEACAPWLRPPSAPWEPDAFSAKVFARLAPLAQERVVRLEEVTALVDFAFVDEPLFDLASWDKAMGTPIAGSILGSASGAFATCAWEAAALKDATAAIGESVGAKLAKAQAPVRVAVTGRTVGLPLFESLEVLGRERVIERLDRAIERLAAGWRPPEGTTA